MERHNPYLRIFNILLTVAAYGYLGYKLVTFSNYAELVYHLQTVTWQEYVFLLVCVLLMPVNVLFESTKWRELLRRVEPMSLCQAQQQVYYGFVGAFVTPYRAGDYPARAMIMQNTSQWSSAIGLGLVGSLALLLVEVILGIPAIILFTHDKVDIPLTRVGVVLMVLLALMIILPMLVHRLAKYHWHNKRLHELFASLSQMDVKQLLRVMAWSAARYAIWGVQLSVVLAFCGVGLSPLECLIAIPTYYLVIAIFPTLPLADIAIRGSWAMIIFGAFSHNIVGITLAVTLIWLINTILPMIVGSILYHKRKNITTCRIN